MKAFGLLLAVVISAWSAGLSAPYQYDDYMTPLKDPASQSLSGFAKSLPRTLRPLTKLTYAAESELGLLTAPERRIINGLLFLAVTGLVFFVLRSWGLGEWSAASFAGVWALHPAHAELWIAIAGRPSLLSLFFMLLAFRFLQCSQTPGRAGASLISSFFAVLSKETAVVWLLACLRLSKDRISGRGWFGGVVALVAACGVVLASSRFRELIEFSFGDPGITNRISLQIAAVSRGTWLLFTSPSSFTVDMDFNPLGLARLAYLLASLAMFAAAFWILSRARDSRHRAAAGLWLSLVLPLHSLFPKLDALTARSFSMSSVAVVLALGLIFQRIRQERVQRFLVSFAVLVLALLGWQSFSQARLYRDPVALWRNTAERSQGSTRPWVNLGTLLAQEGRLEEALKALKTAEARDPFDIDVQARIEGVHTLIESQRLLKEPVHDQTDP